MDQNLLRSKAFLSSDQTFNNAVLDSLDFWTICRMMSQHLTVEEEMK